MKTSWTGLLGLSFALLAAGCTIKAVGPSYAQSRPKSPRADAALVYVMRYYAEPKVNDATLLVDDTVVTELTNGGFTWLYLPPGRHVFAAQWGQSAEQYPTQRALDVEAGRTYYLELTGVSRYSGQGVIRRCAFEQRTFDVVDGKLKVCGYQKPGPAWAAP